MIRRNKTPLSSRKKLRRLTIETPEVDLERLRPKKFNLDATNPLVSSPSHWAAGSEPNFESQPTQDTNNQSGTKRKKPGDFEPDFALQGMATPDTPYGAFIRYLSLVFFKYITI